jgi:hypothetical protein
MDYGPAASGMNYATSVVPAGVTIDGGPDAMPLTMHAWEKVDGPQGTIVHTQRVATNIPGITNSFQAFYSDDLTPTETQCSGDAFQYGASGATLNQNVPDTDPISGTTNVFVTTRLMTFLAPGTPTSTAATLSAQTAAPIAVTVSAFAP